MTRAAAALVALLVAATAAGAAGAPGVAAGPSETPTPDATVEHDGDELTLAAAGGQLVRGSTTLPAGSEVTVRIRAASGADEPFVLQRRTTVDESGEFVVHVDLSDAAVGGEFTLAVLGPGGERLVDGLPGRVVEGDVELGLTDSRVSVQRDGTAAMSVHLDGNDDATLAIVGREVTYLLVATITDGDGDGVVDLRFDTAVAGTGADPLSTVAPADEVAVKSETELDSALPPGDYAISLGVDDSTAPETATPTPTFTPSVESSDPEFRAPVTSVRYARTAELPVWLGNASAASVSIGGPDVNYVVDATVRDGDGDNVVVLRFDTAAAGTDEPTLTAAAEADEVTVTSETDLASPPLAPGDYPVELYRKDSGPVTSVATVVVEPVTAIEGADLPIGTLSVEGAAATATTMPERGTETPSRSGHPELSPTVTAGPHGGTVELAVTLGNASEATLEIGAPEVNYVLTATVTDGDGDNRVTVRFDTAAPGTDDPALEAAGEDAVTVRSEETSLEDPPLDPGEYPVTLYRGDDAAGDAVDVGTVILEDGTPWPTATPTSTPTRTATPTVSAPGPALLSPSVVALGGIAVLGLGAAVVLSRRR